jgi:hypothetical protein
MASTHLSTEMTTALGATPKQETADAPITMFCSCRSTFGRPEETRGICEGLTEAPKKQCASLV